MKHILTAALICFSVSAHAIPAEVLIVRHAEKISDDDPNLSKRGFDRAAALPKLLLQDQRMLEFGRPVAVYAGSAKKKTGSQRPFQTIKPTADQLGLNVITTYQSDDYYSMVAEVPSRKAYDGKTVLISWPHDQIPDMAHAFGMKKKRVPKWKGETYDRVWRLKFDAGDVSTFDDLPQNLLPGDSSN